MRNLVSDGNPSSQINLVIERCLGGPPPTDMMQQVALKQAPVTQFLKILPASFR
ncbi:MAG: hypothetical protein V7735_14920 [Photobacterium frigidiphilum]|uniref:hypothetical protein n=1 Tax=Photobacterium frigidiphilum TaxID=264736 RepID=UPI0030039F52